MTDLHSIGDQLPNRAKNILTLVEQPPPADLVATEPREELARRLEEILHEHFRGPSADARLAATVRSGQSGHSSREHQIPFCIRVTMDQVLNVAEEADLRAQILHWSTEELPSSPHVLRKVRRLHEAANALRMLATFLKDGWDEPAGSS